jgi:hypothetical protein
VGRVKHGFSIEMHSKKHVTSLSISNEARDRVLFEGFLGELEEISMIEGAALKVKGENGVLRIDLSEKELRKVLTWPCGKSTLSSEVGSYRNTTERGDEKM